MPKFDFTDRFKRDWAKLSTDQRKIFHIALKKFSEDLESDHGFRPGLRVKRVQGAKEPVREMTWAPDGRATWQYGPEVKPGEVHVFWRRIGTHDIFGSP